MAGRVGSKVCTYCVLGWSDFLLLLFSKMGTLLPIGYIFMSSITKSLKILPRAAHERQSFYFQKITETFKMNFIVENLQYISSFYFKEQSPKRKFEIFFIYFILGSPTGENCFLLGQRKNKVFLSFYLFLAFK